MSEFKLTNELGQPVNNAEDLAYFISMQESRPADGPDHSAQKWNRRAELWKMEREKKHKGDERMNSAINYLEQRGVLRKDYNILDIGCGPGRFAAAFAKKAHFVVGLDISEKMVEHGMEHIREEGVTNAILRTCDFQTLDIDKEGYRGAFDLVFSSMTPAIHGMNGLQKSMDMSRNWCCNITHLSGRNHLREQIVLELFGNKPVQQWTGRWFYSLFNVLFLMGYHPETSYDTLRRETLVRPEAEYVEFIMEHMMADEERNEKNAEKILEWMKRHADGNGFLQEVSESSYARILWNVNEKAERPDYRSMR